MCAYIGSNADEVAELEGSRPPPGYRRTRAPPPDKLLGLMSNRKEQKEKLRQERLQREAAAEQAAQRKKLVGYGAAALLALAAIVAVVIAATGGDDSSGRTHQVAAPEESEPGTREITFSGGSVEIPEQQELDLRTAARAASCKLEDPPNEGNTHVEGDVEYRANPPTSGNHHPIATADGAYTSRPRLENSVHSLEHGRIHIQFKSDLPQEQIDQLKALFDEDPYHMLIYPNDDLPVPVAATTWDHALLCEGFSPEIFDAIRTFKDEYRDQGPEFVP